MRKTLMILALLVFVLPLSAYSVNALKNSNSNRQVEMMQSPAKIVNKNQKAWNKLIAKADVINSDEFESKDDFAASSLTQLQNHSKSTIMGTIYNLQKMNSPENMAYTKVTVHVDKVLTGDKDLKGKNIYLALPGGLVSFDHWYANMSKPKDFDHEMLVKNDEAPLPTIGSKIITGLIPSSLDEPSEYNDALKQSGFTNKNYSAISDPRYNLWIKKKGSKNFVLNNPVLRKKADKKGSLAKSIQKLTDEINREYNKTKK